MIDALADNIGRHMEKQGFWDDEVEVALTLVRGALDPDQYARVAKTARRWKDAEKFLLLVSEIVEHQDAERKGVVESDHLPGFSMAEEEYADVLIRLLDHAKRRKLRIGEALAAKLEYNGSRPFRHGKKF